MKTIVRPTHGPLRGTLSVPGDKSISHRALLFGALANGRSRISGLLSSGDCRTTRACLERFGVEIEDGADDSVIIHGVGLRGLTSPADAIDCGRSGTTMRLLAGILAGQNFSSTLTGDDQLLRRPMLRIVKPLQAMGGEIESADGRAPLRIVGTQLRGIAHTLSVASAQVKSALLLAGLYADGPTTICQCGPARDHTERMLEAMGASIQVDGLTVAIDPSQSLSPLSISIPGDISSAAFPIVAALLVPGSEITLTRVGLNPTRTGLLDVLETMGARIQIDNRCIESGEPVGDFTVRASRLTSTTIDGNAVVRMIDEFPILAVAASFAHGTTIVRGAAELRVKETDRIATILAELRTLGARIDEHPDGFEVHGPTALQGGIVDSHRDHRLAMALTVAGLAAKGNVTVDQAEYAADSYPRFLEQLYSLEAER